MKLQILLDLPAARLKRILAIKTQIENLQAQLQNLAGEVLPAPFKKVIHKRRQMSAAARKKISMAAKARWAKVRAAKAK